MLKPRRQKEQIMADFGLPTSVTVGGRKCRVSTDFRVILDVCTTLTDTTLTEQERAFCALYIFYRGKIPTEDLDAAWAAMYDFIRAGVAEDADSSSPTLVNWDKDYPIIVPAVNRVLGCECRVLDHLHWWTFVGAYMEIGDCLFSQVVQIRDKQARGKKLEKYEKDFIKRNRALITLPRDQEIADLEKMIREGIEYG